MLGKSVFPFKLRYYVVISSTMAGCRNHLTFKLLLLGNIGVVLGNLYFSRSIISTAVKTVYSVYAADFDNDGLVDVLSASVADDKIAWYRNEGGGMFSSQRVITTAADGAWSVYAADLNNDGLVDVLSASVADDKIAWYRNEGGGTFSSQRVISTASDGARSVYAADLDNDGLVDVLSASYSDAKIAWYRNEGGGMFSIQRVISTAADGASSVYASDLDNDGLVDVLSASPGDAKIAWYRNEGGGTFSSQRAITTAADGASSVYASDLDNDGLVDVLSASPGDDKIAWYRNEGGGMFSPQRVISTAADGAWSVYAADLDNDGLVDVLSASAVDAKIAWYRNEGGGTFSSQRVITTAADVARSVYAASLNNNGFMSVLSASSGDNEIAVHDLRGNRFVDYNVVCSLMEALPSWKSELDWDECCELPSFLSLCGWEGITGAYGPEGPRITHIHVSSLPFVDAELLSSLGGLPSLVSLSVRNLELDFVPAAWCNLTSLEFLDVSYNRISALPEACSSLHLKALDVSHNHFTNLPTHQLLLSSLNISHNNITELHLTDFAHIPSLKNLDMSRNPTKAILGAASSEECSSNGTRASSSLKSLDLSALSISSIEGTLCFLDELESLSLAHNDLTVLKGTWTFPKLNTLDVSFNAVESHVLPQMPYVTHLVLAHNNIQRLQTNETSMFHRLPLLEVLDLSYNPILNIEAAAFGAVSLKRVNLSSSSAVHVHPTAWGHLNAVAAVTIEGSPLALVEPCITGNESMCTGTFETSRTLFCMRLQDGEYCPSSRGSLVCEPGYACTQGIRTQCPAGKYALEGAATCTVCPHGRYSGSPASASCTVCEAGFACDQGHRQVCQAGTASSLGSTVCRPCGDGAYSLEDGATACTQCEAGYFCSQGNRKACSAGTFSGSGMSACTPCGPGTYTSSNASAVCTVCEAGYACRGGSHRDACLKGTYSVTGASACTACSPGTYTSSNASAVCTVCEAGYACRGGSHRDACLKGTYSVTGASACTACSPRTYTSDGASTSCIPCEAGHACAGGFAREPCPQDTFAAAEASECEPCPLGTFSGPAASQCKSCPAGFVSNTTHLAVNGTVECIVCPPGTLYRSATPGQAFPSCVACRPGFGCDGGATPEVPCPVGRFSEGGGSDCTPCPAGTMGKPPWVISSQAFVRDSAVAACVACPLGRFTNAAGQTSCQACPPATRGMFHSQTRRPVCTPCNATAECPMGVLRPLRDDVAALSTLHPSVAILGSARMAETSEVPVATRNSPEAPSRSKLPQEKSQTSASTEDTMLPVSAMIYGTAGVAILSAALVLFVCKTRVKTCLSRIDIFNLDHPLRPQEVMTSHPTFTGGLFTTATLLVVLALLTNAAYDYFSEGNRTFAMTVVPVAELPAQGTPYFYMDLLVHGDAPWLDAAILPPLSTNDTGCSLIYSIEVSSSMELEAASCSERPGLPEAETACTCVLVPSHEGSLVFPFMSTIAVRLHSRTTVLASQLVSQSASGNFSVLETAVPLRTASGIPRGIDIGVRVLPDVMDNRVSQRLTTGYTLFSQGAAYTPGSRHLFFQGNESMTATFSIQLENLGRVTEVDLKTTAMQAVSSAFGLIVGSLGALRLLFRYTRKTHRNVRARKLIGAKGGSATAVHAVASKLFGASPPLTTEKNMGTAAISLQSWRSNPLMHQQLSRSDSGV